MTALVFALVRRHLAGGGEGEAAALADTVEVVGGLAVHTALVLALLVLVEFLEAVLGIGIILDVVALVLLNVTLVLEGEGAPGTPGKKWSRKTKEARCLVCVYCTWIVSRCLEMIWSSPAVEVGGLLPIELTAHSPTVLGCTEPLEAVVYQLCVLLMEVLMSHDIRGASVHLVTAHLVETRKGKNKGA